MNIAPNKQLIKESLNAIVSCLDRIASERDQIKEICKIVEDKADIPPKYTKKLAKIIQTASTVSHKQELEDFDTLIDEIINQ